MNKNNVFYFFLIGSLLTVVCSLMSIHYFNNWNAEEWLDRGWSIFEISGVVLLLSNGTLVKTKYFVVLCIGFIVLLVGVLFKIMHWPYSEFILLFSVLLICIVYLFSFLNKNQKGVIDFLKLAWVVIRFLGSFFIIYRFVSYHILIVPHLLLVIMIIAQVYNSFAGKKLSR